MAKVVPAVQLHGKQPWPQQVKKNGQKAKGQRAKAKSKTTFRSQALKDGSLPPARRPIFVRDNVRGQKGVERNEWRLEMKRLGAMWHKLPIAEKQRYFEQSDAEFATTKVANASNAAPAGK